MVACLSMQVFTSIPNARQRFLAWKHTHWKRVVRDYIARFPSNSLQMERCPSKEMSEIIWDGITKNFGTLIKKISDGKQISDMQKKLS